MISRKDAMHAKRNKNIFKHGVLALGAAPPPGLFHIGARRASYSGSGALCDPVGAGRASSKLNVRNVWRELLTSDFVFLSFGRRSDFGHFRKSAYSFRTPDRGRPWATLLRRVDKG